MMEMMEARRLFTLVIIVTTFYQAISAQSEADYVSNESRLHNLLMGGYDTNVRPVQRHNDTVDVKLGLALITVDELNEVEEVLTTSVWLRMQWTDPRLRWNPDDFGGVRETRFPMSEIWQPDITLYNSAGPSGFQNNFDALAVVASSGSVLFVPSMTLKTRCSLDLRKFPFDKQHCLMKFGSWTHGGHAMDLNFYNNHSEVDLNDFIASNKFDVEQAVGRRNVKYYPCCYETYPDITFTLTLKRTVSHTTLLFTSPSIVLALLVPAIFILPPESTHKIILGVGVMIGHVLLFGQLEMFVHFSHPTIPHIGVFFVTNIILVCLSLFVSAFIVNAWNRSHRRTPVPTLLRTLFLGLFSRLLCTSREDFLPNYESQQMGHNTLKTGGNSSQTGHLSPQTGQDESGVYENEPGDRQQMVATYQQIVSVAEWRQLACIFDRLFLILFTVIVIITAAAMR